MPKPVEKIVIAHVLYRLDIGGLESVIMNLVNLLPPERFEHAVISLTICTDFQHRFHHPAVTFHSLHKQEGKDWMVWVRLWRLLRRLRPDLLHTCNLAAMEAVIPAWLAGVGFACHAEHGRDSYDPDGTKFKYLLLRRLLTPFVDRFIPVSRDLEGWLRDKVKVPEAKINCIINGVSLPEQSRLAGRVDLPKGDFAPSSAFVIGTVGRMWPIKDHLNLVHGFARLCQQEPEWLLRLVIVGDGPQRPEVERLIEQLGLSGRVWITGWREDVTELMLGFDLFVLSSQAEGTPLTILEAMAAGLPVVSTRVGGVADLVVHQQTGYLVPAGDAEELASAMHYYLDPVVAASHGAAGRARIREHFSIHSMVEAYRLVFEKPWLRKIK